MDERLIRHFLAYTSEEKDLLEGKPLRQATYTRRQAFIVQGERFVPASQMITLRQHTRFVDFPTHWHDYVEMMYMLSGETRHHMPDGQTIALQSGELLLINRHSSHSIEKCGERDLAVNFIIEPAFFDFVPEMVGAHNELGHFLLDALRNDEKDVSYLHFHIAEKVEIQRLLESIIYSMIAPVPATLRIQRMEMGLLFLHLLGRPECMTLPANTYQENLYVIRLLAEIREHYATFSLKSYAEKYHVSSAYLCGVLKEATQKTCTELLQERRLEIAKHLLRETDLSVLDICQTVGYSNSSYFYRIFTSQVGCSPKEWRVNTGRSQT